jgi:hypothetical protein
MELASKPRPDRMAEWFSLGLLSTIIGFGIWLTVRNLRSGRGDVWGALRLTLFVFIVGLVNWLLLAHHVASTAEAILLILALGAVLFFSSLTWLLYISLEPYVRRYWPDTIISWTRLLNGQFTDPVLGRDLLLGTLFGVTSAVLEHTQPILEAALGRPPVRPLGLFNTYTLEGFRGCLASILFQASQAIPQALLLFFLFFLARLALKKHWLAALLTSLIFCIPSLAAPNPLIDALLYTMPFVFLYLFILYRFGLVTLAALYFADQLADNMPVTTPLNAWYTLGGLTAVIVILLIAFYGFQISRAGKPVFGSSALELK